jgi:hypothetical protein
MTQVLIYITSIIFLQWCNNAAGDCPAPSDLPVIAQNGYYVASYSWDQAGEEPISSCTGSKAEILLDGWATAGYSYVASLVVRPGCTFYGFENNDEGDGEVGYIDQFVGPPNSRQHKPVLLHVRDSTLRLGLRELYAKGQL